MKNKKLVCILIAFIVIVLSSGAVLAGDKPLNLKASDPVNGQKNVSVNSVIKLKFSGNVVNFKIKEHNMKCFKLLDEHGCSIPLEVIMADDQLYREKRKDVKIKPVNSLSNNTYYTLIIKPDLTKKNGNKLGKPHFITFGTK